MRCEHRDVGKSRLDPAFVLEQAELAHAGRIDQDSPALELDELPRARRVAAAVVVAQACDRLHVSSEQPVRERPWGRPRFGTLVGPGRAPEQAHKTAPLGRHAGRGALHGLHAEPAAHAERQDDPRKGRRCNRRGLEEQALPELHGGDR